MKSILHWVFLLFIGPVIAQIQTPEVILTDGSLCQNSDCATFEVAYTPIFETTDYSVTAIPYQPVFPFTGGTPLLITSDDTWSSPISLSFPFCFYGNTYQNIYVGSNGVITFDIQPFTNNTCPWDFSEQIPSTSFPVKNAIYGVYQDNDITSIANPNSNINYYLAGTAPNRVFVVNYNNLTSFLCDQFSQTSQIVFYEGTNNIEVYILSRTPCMGWSNPNGLIGVQNAEGTMATVPPDRNTGTWTTQNEAFRFTPSGNELSQISWFINGLPLNEHEASVTICDQEPGILEAQIQYNSCEYVALQNATIEITHPESGQPQDLYSCSSQETATFDLTANTVLLEGNPDGAMYEVAYFLTLTDAELYANPIQNTTAFTGTNDQQIYALATGLNVNCSFIRAFHLYIDAPIAPPTGPSIQFYTPGQTLADLDVQGNEIQWFADEDATQPLPETTELQDGTYYALETYIAPSCQSMTSRNAFLLDNMLAVTVYNVLSTSETQEVKIRISPNPTQGNSTITSNLHIEFVEIFNIHGRNIYRSNVPSVNHIINLAAFSSGLYIVRVESGGKWQTFKLIKN